MIRALVRNPFGSSLRMSLGDLTCRGHLGLTHAFHLDNFGMCHLKPVAYNGRVRWFDYHDPPGKDTKGQGPSIKHVGKILPIFDPLLPSVG